VIYALRGKKMLKKQKQNDLPVGNGRKKKEK